MVIRQGEKDPFIRNIFTLNTCSQIVGSQVLSYMKEDEMLTQWVTFLLKIILKGIILTSFFYDQQ